MTFYLTIINKKKFEKIDPKLLNTKIRLLILFALMFIQLTTIVVSGSRGPLLTTIIVSIIIITFRQQKKSIVVSIIIILLLVTLLLRVLPIIEASVFFNSIRRTLTLFTLNKNAWGGRKWKRRNISIGNSDV